MTPEVFEKDSQERNSYPLTTQQKNIWNLQKYHEGSAISNICGAIIYEDDKDIAKLEQSVRYAIENQTAFGLRFSDTNQIKQYWSDEKIDIDTRFFSDESELDDFANKAAREPMRMVNSPMCVFAIFRLGTRTGILTKMNHLIADAWSFGVLARQIDMYYECLSSEEHSHEESIARDVKQCGDYLCYVKDDLAYRSSERFEKDRLFWKEKYCSRPERSAISRIDSTRIQEAKANRIKKKLSKDLTREINEFCHRNNITAAVVFESAVLLYLSRINYENRTNTIGIPILNRNKLKEKQTVGMYISTMPLKVDFERLRTVRELLEKVATVKREMFRHQRFPYEEILREVRSNYEFTGNLFDVMVSVQNSQINRKNGFETKWYPNGYCEVPYVLTVDQRDSRDSYILTADYQTEMFPDETEAEAILVRIENIIRQIVTGAAENNILISEIDILLEKEKYLLLHKFNDTNVKYPTDKCVHELFVEQAERSPNKIALTFENTDFTYRQLDELSNSIAQYLREKGVERNEVVPIISERDWRIIVAMLGVLKAGGAYMPVSPDLPIDRIMTMLKTAECKRALCFGYSHNLPVDQIDLSEFSFQNVMPLKNVNQPSDVCYVIFTSGSTGTPKGCIVSHNNFTNTLYWHKDVYDSDKNIISISSLTTDTLAEDIWANLLCENRIILIKDHKNPHDINAAIKKLKDKACLMTTPTFFSAIMSVCPSIEWDVVTLVGEELTIDTVNKYKHAIQTLCNAYGPSECSVCASYTKINEIKNHGITVGRPITNTQIYILDSQQKLLPIGVSGELCIAGAGVGKGYLNRPELTAERFIRNPYATEENGHGEVMYRTGDLARWKSDGEIEYLGRIDTQVKIRGLRIELGEIESVMAQMESVSLTAVATQKDETGRQYLVGYYTSELALDEKEMRKHLSEKLPQYMVPNYFMRLQSMPTTTSGKTDRKNLPNIEITGFVREFVAPETEKEKLLCKLMANILSVDRVGVTDDFFELGGDSLGAISLVALAHENGIELRLQTLFDYSNVRALCANLENTDTNVKRLAFSKKDDISLKDYEKYWTLLQKNIIDNSILFEKKEIRTVFLTGATGFLGAHVLDVLMRQTKSRVYCLVRNDPEKDVKKKLTESLNWYFGETYSDEIGNRIIPVEGDIENDDISNALPIEVEIVIHAAATVKHYGAYDDFRRINVEGTKRVAAYAKLKGATLIHISTISISGNATNDSGIRQRKEKELSFGETDYYIGQELNNVYIRSKFEAEQVVMDEMINHGLDAKVIRVGNLTNRVTDYRFQPNYESNAFLKRLKAIIELGSFPDYLIPQYSEFSPVDLTAEGIVKIAQYAREQTIFHLYNDKPLANESLISILQSIGISLKTVSGDEFSAEVEKSLRSHETDFIFKSLRNDMDENGRLGYESNIRIKNDFTMWFMSQVGFQWHEIEEEYVRGYIEYFRKAGFLNV